MEGRRCVANLACAARKGEIGDVATLAEGIGGDAEMLDGDQFAPHEPDGEPEQHQGQSELGQDVGETRAEGEPDMRHQHVHDVAVAELDFDQHLAAADSVVDEERALQVGFQGALDLARDDVEVGWLLEGPNDPLAETDEQQQVLGGAVEDPGAVRIVGKVGPQRDQDAEVAHQKNGQSVGDVVSALAVEPPGAQRLQQQHRHHDDDQSPRKQRLRRMVIRPLGDAFENLAGAGDPHASTSR